MHLPSLARYRCNKREYKIRFISDKFHRYFLPCYWRVTIFKNGSYCLWNIIFRNDSYLRSPERCTLEKLSISLNLKSSEWLFWVAYGTYYIYCSDAMKQLKSIEISDQLCLVLQTSQTERYVGCDLLNFPCQTSCHLYRSLHFPEMKLMKARMISKQHIFRMKMDDQTRWVRW